MTGADALTEERVFQLADGGRAAPAGLDLVRRGRFQEPLVTADRAFLAARCEGGGPAPYPVSVDLYDPTAPVTGCGCGDPRWPCKHALGLMLLYVRDRGSFRVVAADRGRATPPPPSPAPAAGPASVREAFLRDVLAHPDDETPRLLFADWLQDRGDPRGEFIQVQCLLRHTAADAPDRPALLEREGQLWRRHRNAWAKDLPYALRGGALRFHRGFLEEVRLTPSRFVGHAARLLACHPVQRLRLPPASHPSEYPALAGCPFVRNLTALDLGGCRVTADVVTLLRTPFWKNLRRLSLAGNVGLGAGLYPVLTGEYLTGLARLDLSGCHLTDATARVLADVTRLPGLVELTLRDNALGTAGAVALAQSPHLAHLERIDLRGNAVGVAGREALKARFGAGALLDEPP